MRRSSRVAQRRWRSRTFFCRRRRTIPWRRCRQRSRPGPWTRRGRGGPGPGAPFERGTGCPGRSPTVGTGVVRMLRGTSERTAGLKMPCWLTSGTRRPSNSKPCASRTPGEHLTPDAGLLLEKVERREANRQVVLSPRHRDGLLLNRRCRLWWRRYPPSSRRLRPPTAATRTAPTPPPPDARSRSLPRNPGPGCATPCSGRGANSDGGLTRPDRGSPSTRSTRRHELPRGA